MKFGWGFVAVFATFVVGGFARAPIVRAADIQDRIVLTLDSGFVGRPVSLDVFGGSVRVSWDAGDLIAPTMLMVERETSASSSIIHLAWADPYNVAERGVRVETPSECVPDAFTTCTLQRQNGNAWADAKDGRVYGYSIVRIVRVASPYMKSGSASWYKYKNCRCAASPDFPKGTRVKVTSQLTGKSTVVRINDWGPERDKFPDRVIDLDKLAFKEFAPTGAGLIRVTVKPLDPKDPEYALADLPLTVPVEVVKKTVAVSTAPPVTTTGWSY